MGTETHCYVNICAKHEDNFAKFLNTDLFYFYSIIFTDLKSN